MLNWKIHDSSLCQWWYQISCRLRIFGNVRHAERCLLTGPSYIFLLATCTSSGLCVSWGWMLFKKHNFKLSKCHRFRINYHVTKPNILLKTLHWLSEYINVSNLTRCQKQHAWGLHIFDDSESVHCSQWCAQAKCSIFENIRSTNIGESILPSIWINFKESQISVSHFESFWDLVEIHFIYISIFPKQSELFYAKN